MDMQGLLEKLKIETPSQLEFFEQYAELAETEDGIPEDVLAEFFADADAESLRELTDAYFEEILSGVPDDGTEFYLLIMNIGRALSKLASGSDAAGAGDANRAYAEEFHRFRLWYATERNVVCGEERLSVLEALAAVRAEKLTTGANRDATEKEFDFTGALGYEIAED